MSAEGQQWGVINPGELYTLESLKRRLGIRDSTLRAARRAGLQVYRKHGRGYVLGQEWIRYICTSDIIDDVERGTA